MNRAEDLLKHAQRCRDKAAQFEGDAAARWLRMAIAYEDLARNYFLYNRLDRSNMAAE